jgi:hypothetical protein
LNKKERTSDMIRKKEEVGNLSNKKGVSFPILDSNQTETAVKYLQKVENETNK